MASVMLWGHVDHLIREKVERVVKSRGITRSGHIHSLVIADLKKGGMTESSSPSEVVNVSDLTHCSLERQDNDGQEVTQDDQPSH